MAEQPPNSESGWYLKQAEASDEYGPFAADSLLAYASAGTINPQTLVKHVINTRNQWVLASQIPNLEAAMNLASAGEPEVGSMVNLQLPNASSKIVIGAIVVLGTIMLSCGGIGSIFTSNIRKQTPEQKAASDMAWDEFDYGQQAEREFKKVVGAVLKTPTTAEYSLTTKVMRGDRGKVLLVDGTVTSQNSFGTMLTQPASGIFWRGKDDTSNRLAYANLNGETLPVGNAQVLSWCKQLIEKQTGEKIVR